MRLELPRATLLFIVAVLASLMALALGLLGLFMWPSQALQTGFLFAYTVFVILTAGVLYFQLGELRNSIRASTYQSVTANESLLTRIVMRYPELLFKVWKPWYDAHPEKAARLTDPANARAFLYLYLMLDFYENLLEQNKIGVIVGQEWEEWEAYMRDELDGSLIEEYWEEPKLTYGKALKDFIEKKVLPPRTDPNVHDTRGEIEAS